jgi:ribonuclease-3
VNSASLEKTINYSFNTKALIKEALTHRSYRNENPGWETPHNERLEFLGDAVLELTVTEELYNRFPEEDEGKLTSIRAALVNYQLLAKAGTISRSKNPYCSPVAKPKTRAAPAK